MFVSADITDSVALSITSLHDEALRLAAETGLAARAGLGTLSHARASVGSPSGSIRSSSPSMHGFSTPGAPVPRRSAPNVAPVPKKGLKRPVKRLATSDKLPKVDCDNPMYVCVR